MSRLHCFPAARGSCYLLTLGLLAGCANSRPADTDPEHQFGNYEEGTTDGRATLNITPPDTMRSYFYYPAPIDEITVRQAPMLPNPDGSFPQVDVEVLLKGAFPDACHELHDAEQERAGNIITVTLQMRRPRGALCASVMRPYRFYLPLEGKYDAGPYTLKLNDQVHPFVVEASSLTN
jgi:hypothetical protein